MKTFQNWLSEHTNQPPAKKNAQGGFDPQDAKDLAKHKKADLITLPLAVEGTNCGNCEYITKKKDGVGYCRNKEIQEWVTVRQCCKYWDNSKVKRKWGSEAE